MTSFKSTTVRWEQVTFDFKGGSIRSFKSTTVRWELLHACFHMVVIQCFKSTTVRWEPGAVQGLTPI